jgi:hypothetical protein
MILDLSSASTCQGFFHRGELDIDALLLVDDHGDFALDHVLHGGHGAIADGELRNALDVDGGAVGRRCC